MTNLKVSPVRFPDGLISVGSSVGHTLHVLDGELWRYDSGPVLGVVIPAHQNKKVTTNYSKSLPWSVVRIRTCLVGSGSNQLSGSGLGSEYKKS